MFMVVLAGAAVCFMAGVVVTLAITRPPILSDEQWIDAMARRDAKAARL